MITSLEVKPTASTQPSSRKKTTDTDSTNQVQVPILQSPKGLFTKFLSRKKNLVSLPVSPTSVAAVASPSLPLSLPLPLSDTTSQSSTAIVGCASASVSTCLGEHANLLALPQEESAIVPHNQIQATSLTPRNFERHSNSLASQKNVPSRLQLISKPYDWENGNKSCKNQEDLNVLKGKIRNEDVVNFVDFFHDNNIDNGSHRNDIIICKDIDKILTSMNFNEEKRDYMISSKFGDNNNNNNDNNNNSNNNNNGNDNSTYTNSNIESKSNNNFRDVSGSIDLYDTNRKYDDNYRSNNDISNNSYGNDSNMSYMLAEKNRRMNNFDNFSNNNSNNNIFKNDDIIYNNDAHSKYDCNNNNNTNNVNNNDNNNDNNINNNNNNKNKNWHTNNDNKNGSPYMWDRNGSESTEIISYRESRDYHDHSVVTSSSKTFNLTEMSRSLSFLSVGVHEPSLDDTYLQPTKYIPQQERVRFNSPPTILINII